MSLLAIDYQVNAQKAKGHAVIVALTVLQQVVRIKSVFVRQVATIALSDGGFRPTRRL